MKKYDDYIIEEDDMEDAEDYYSEGRERALQKNNSLIESLETKRNTLCGIGTNKAKRRLNKFIKEDYVANFLRVALEAEDKSIIAKKMYGEYKDKTYRQKHEYIKQLYEISIKNNIKCGIQESDCISTSHVIYFHTPINDLQISWHIIPDKDDNFEEYSGEWDKVPNSTLDKLEVDIEKYLADKGLLKDADKNKASTKKHKSCPYKVKIYNKDRFAIYDENDVMVDDAQGYGFKTLERASKAMWYKFRGGKEKIMGKKVEAKNFIQVNPQIAKEIYDMHIVSFKEFARGEYTNLDIVKCIEEEHGISVKKDIIDNIIEIVARQEEKEEEARYRENEKLRREQLRVKREESKQIREKQKVRFSDFDIKILPLPDERFAIYNKRNRLLTSGYRTHDSAANFFMNNFANARTFKINKEIISQILNKNPSAVETMEQMYKDGKSDVEIRQNIKDKFGIEISQELLDTINLLKI